MFFFLILVKLEHEKGIAAVTTYVLTFLNSSIKAIKEIRMAKAQGPGQQLQYNEVDNVSHAFQSQAGGHTLCRTPVPPPRPVERSKGRPRDLRAAQRHRGSPEKLGNTN